jgi:hypothetical protein
MLKKTLLLLFQIPLLLQAQSSIDRFEQCISLGDYQTAFEVLSERDFSREEKAYCTARFLTDLGARNTAILVLDSLLKAEEMSPTVSPDLVYKMELVMLDALYEEAQIEAFAQQCSKTETFIDRYLSNNAMAKATIQAFWSRYYARNMELYYSSMYAYKSLLLIKDLGEVSLDLMRIKALALNGLRNAPLPGLDQPHLIEIRNNIYNVATGMSTQIRNKKTPFNFNDARTLIVLGNIIQDQAAGVRNIQSAEDMLLSQKAYKNALLNFNKATEIATETIGQNNWLTCNAAIILGLLSTYEKDYKKSTTHFSNAVAYSILPTDSNLLLNNDKRNVAIKLYSWMAYKYGFIPEDSIAFKEALTPYFTATLDNYTRQQFINFRSSEKWLKDGYREHPSRDFYPFLAYFDGWNEKSIIQSRKHQAFLDYAGSKFKLIARVMGPRFLEQTTALIETNRLLKIGAEIDYLKSLDFWSPEFLSSKHRPTTTKDFSELEGYLKGDFFPNLEDIQSSLKQGNAYIEFSDIETENNHKETFLFIILPDTIFIEKVSSSELKKRFLESKTWKQDHYEAQATFFSISSEIWFRADSILTSKNVHNVRICPNLYNSILPFEALVNEKGQKAIERFEISYVLDLGIEQLIHLLPKSRVNAFASFHPNYLQNPLPFSKHLSDGLGLKFGVKLPEDLSLSELKNAMQNSSVFHVGAHGSSLSGNGTGKFFFLGSKYADSTFIFLENEKRALMEFNDLKLNSDLIVVTACESGDGVLKLGEGKIDFTRTFLQAGSKGVITGLWKLDDYATSKILEHFYNNLENGESCVHALRNAKLAFLKEETDPVYQHPKYWAGIIYVGEDQHITLKTKANYWWFTILLLFPLVFFLFKWRFSHK